MLTRVHAIVSVTAIACLTPWSGCASPEEGAAGSVASAWQAKMRQGNTASAEEPDTAGSAVTDIPDRASSAGDDEVIAVVNGQPISRSRVVELILQSHGIGVLEQLIGLEAARQSAKRKGVTIAESDVHFEFDLALRRLSDPLASVASGEFDRTEAQRVLDAVLAERNISREELFVTLRRNAYLRKIIRQDLAVTEQQLRDEFDRVYGDRVEVRHIQLGSPGEAARISERVARGEEFAELASRYSANVGSGRRGGLLDPFSSKDEEIPVIFRQVAFALHPGEVSDVVRVGEWHHLIKLERILPAESHDFDDVRSDLERRLTERLVETQMRELYEELLGNASIEIRDPTLRVQFEQRHRQRSP